MINTVATLYWPILIFMGLATIMGCAMILAGKIFASYLPYSAKNSPYECGFEASGDASIKFDIRYYLIAILFILFDIEIAFLVPWALVFKPLGLYGLQIMAVFMLILVVGFIYIWLKGALEWE
jgi:NADH-quinone oxidoreductase subunit A